MIVYASVLRVRTANPSDDPISLLVDTSFVMLSRRTVYFIKAVLEVREPELASQIDWTGSADTSLEQYRLLTVEGSRPVELIHFGGVDAERNDW